jgi:hypothetical protein
MSDSFASSAIPWSKYDRNTLAVGVKAVGEMLGRIGNIDDELFRDVIAFAVIEGMGDDPSKVQAPPTEALDWVAGWAEKARKMNGFVSAHLNGYLRCGYVDGEVRTMVTEAGKTLVRQVD